MGRHTIPPRPCTREQLQSNDLALIVIQPTISAKDPERRFRCPAPSCLYNGWTVAHPGDCLRHLLDPRVGAHKQFFASSLVTFINTEGKPVLNSRVSTPSAFLFLEGHVTKPQCAYMKVCIKTAFFMHGLVSRLAIRCCAQVGGCAMCVRSRPHRHARAVRGHCARSTKSTRL